MTLTGTIVRGQGRGKQLGFPTANLKLENDIEKPAAGVYAGRGTVDAKTYPAAIHVGPVPTFNEETPTVEAHLLDYAGPDLYDKTVQLEIIAKIRNIEKFESPEELSTAIASDCRRAREIVTASSPQ